MLEDTAEWEVKTITSAIKQYFRNLPEPLMTYRLHCAFIVAAKQDQLFRRVNDIHALVHKLPKTNFMVLKTLIQHLVNVAAKSEKNLMTIFGTQPEPPLDVSRLSGESAGSQQQQQQQHRQQQQQQPSSKSSSPSASLRHNNQQQQQQHNNHNNSSSKHPPVLKKVVTYNISEPQTPLFGAAGGGGIGGGGGGVGVGGVGGLSNIKGSSGSSSGSSGLYSTVAPPPSITHQWTNSSSLSSLTSGLNAYSSLVSNSAAIALGASTNNSTPRLSPQGPLPQTQVIMTSKRYPPPPKKPMSTTTINNYHHHHQQQQQQQQQYLQGGVGAMRDPRLQQQQQQQQQQQTNHFAYNSNMRLGAAYPPTYRQHMETNSISGSQSTLSLLTSTGPPSSSPPPPPAPGPTTTTTTTNGALNTPPRRVRTLYACVGENESELSFEPNQILRNVRASREPGWLEGTLNGRTGLVPENYVEGIDDTPPPLPTVLPSQQQQQQQHNTDV
ncbi:hypothetical protein Pmani_029922 [Petrolisthes manimaculis]|uniref:Rho GTPase-activating protein 26 n=2 Tax=Petrolisthes manimaculis TaxID=1843537 RepID=A0AAE1NYH3_9EUCA|nr:hypothetical protein Pmani_029922 [Petrolisthes manimaculis]